MADWNQVGSEPEKELSSIGGMFELGKVKRMYDIVGLYPTKITRLLGINQERYAIKLSSPDKFSVSEILKMAYIFNIDPTLILDVIQKEMGKTIANKIGIQRKKLS